MKTFLFVSAIAGVFLMAALGVAVDWRTVPWEPREHTNQGAAWGGFQWKQIQGHPDSVALYQHGRQIGAYSYSTGFYHDLIGDQMSGPRKAPIAPPLGGLADPKGQGMFGVTLSGPPAKDKFWTGDGEITAAEAMELIGADVPDDSKNPHVTVISKMTADAKRAVEVWAQNKAKNPELNNVRFQSYDYSQPVNKVMLSPNNLEQDTRFQSSGVVVIAQAAADPKDGTAKAMTWYERINDEVISGALRTIKTNWDPNKIVPNWISAVSVSFEVICFIIGGFIFLVVVFVAAKLS